MESNRTEAHAGNLQYVRDGATTLGSELRHREDAWESFGDDTPRHPPTRTWRHEIPRWLASLTPGRTVREYEKAVTYFFDTPGVPQELRDISFDLLLAYRGALALRATPHERGRPSGPNARSQHLVLDGTQRLALPGPGVTGSHENDASGAAGAPHGAPTGPLAPATVNIRLTALRQFLCHCSLMGELPALSPERVRVALRRLHIERRRPYQVLAEPEWEQFLEAARMPAQVATDRGRRDPSAFTGDERSLRGPWGVPRAQRLADEDDTSAPARASDDATRVRLPKSRAGLTGERTAQRDHALLSLALATGLRSIELAELDVGDLHREWYGGHEEWWLVLPDEKTKGQHGGRTLPLAPTLMETVLAYVRTTGRKWESAADRATPLFLSSGGRKRASDAQAPQSGTYRRLSAAHIRLIVDRVEAQWLQLRACEDAADGMAAGETRAISPHALRHSTAIALLEGNAQAGRAPASVEHVRGWLGHFDIRTTQGYLAHLDSRQHRRPYALAPAAPPTSARNDQTNQATGAEPGAPAERENANSDSD